jgi:hypothetical protein
MKVTGQIHTPVDLSPKKKAHGILLTGCSVGHRADPEICFVKEEKSLVPAGNRAPDRPAHNLPITLPKQYHS